jgi:hypothetical protein
MVFGVYDWAPYLTCIWIPFFVLISVVTYTRDIGSGRWAVILYVATLPMLGAAITEFRPDIGNGILAATCIVAGIYAVTAPGSSIRSAQVLGAGLLMGLALLAKPSAAIYTVGLIGLGLLVILLGIFLYQRSMFPEAFRRMTLICLVGIGLAGPYYIVAGPRVIEYTWNAIVRDKSIWEVKFTLWQHAGFYLVGHGGKFMLGLHLWAACISIALMLVFRKSFSTVQRLRFYTVLITALVGYLIVTINTVKTHFLGVTFQALLVALSILIFIELLRIAEKRTYRLVLYLVLIAAGLAGLLSIQPAGFWGFRDALAPQETRRIVAEVSETLRQIAGNSDQPKTVFVTFTGFLNLDVLNYNLLKYGVTHMRAAGWFFRPAEEDPVEVFGRQIDRSDIVIAATEGTLVAQSGMPSNQILPLTLSLVQQHPQFTLLTTFPSGKGSIQLYTRKAEQPHIENKY